MRKQFKTLSALMLSAVLAVSALPFSKVEAKSKWVEINGVNYEINRITGECEASLNVKKGKSEVRIPNKVKYQGDTYKVTFFSWDDWDQDWKEETNRSYKPAKSLHPEKSKILAYSKKMPKSKDYDFFFQSLFKGNQQRYLF